MKTNPPSNCSAELADNNSPDILHWKATIIGPSQTALEGGIFKLDVKFPDNYPAKPPLIKFITKVYHPNINDKGEICLDLLKSQWSPAIRLEKLLLCICTLLQDPNPADPLVPEAADLYKKDINKYNEIVKEYTKKYAK